MIPDHEQERLRLLCQDAYQLADRGLVARGYLSLLQALQCLKAGYDQRQPWWPACRAAWEQAISDYEAEFHLRPTPPARAPAGSPVIPGAEFDALIRVATHAQEAAQRGHTANGYAWLLAGLERLRAAQESGAPWAPKLVDRWEFALNRYCEEYCRIRE